MMDRKKQIVKLLSALVLFIALMLPTFIQFAHVFDIHEHTVCTDQDLHIDQTRVKCEICTIQVSSFDYSFNDNSEILQFEIIVLKQEGFHSLIFDALIYNSNPLRGPPFSILS